MAKQVITVEGEDKVVREDTAKSFRGVYWAYLSIGAILVLLIIFFFGGMIMSAINGTVDSPAAIEREAGR